MKRIQLYRDEDIWKVLHIHSRDYSKGPRSAF